MISRLLSGAKVILYINGNPYAAVVSFKWDSTTGRKAIYGLDSGEPYELAPTTNKIVGTMMLLRTIGDGAAEGAGLVAQFADVPREKYFSLSLIERSTDTQIFRADRCSVLNQSWDVPSKGLAMGSLNFEALSWNNESVSL
jgi:hypothetical protein